MKKWLSVFILFLFISFLFPPSAFAQENMTTIPMEKKFEATVISIKEEKEIETNGTKQLYQKLELQITSGDREGNKITVENGNIPATNVSKYKAGDKLVVSALVGMDGKEIFYITDYVRRSPLYLLFALFVGAAVLIGRKRGISALLGLLFSFFIIFIFILPQILLGKDPILVAIIASILIIPVTFYLSHGLNKKTTIAIIGTIISLTITGILANLFVDATKLTGFASEEVGFIEAAKPGLINIRGLLLAGIIIGALGILDDITIAQTALVQQLKRAAPKLSMGELFSRGMDVGRDHIASVVNTLVLVYTGAALPLLLLFIDSPTPFSEVINYEILAEEIVRTLIASIGLILAVPIVTFISAYVFSKARVSG